MTAEACRVRIDLSYDGGGFSGWARQPGQRTVQQVLEDALSQVLRADPPVQLTVAGRTDAGVHARGQVAHADLPLAVDERQILREVVHPHSIRHALILALERVRVSLTAGGRVMVNDPLDGPR